MLRGSAAFEQAVSGPHAARVKAQAWLGMQPVGDLRVTAASVTCDSGQFARRSLSLTVANTPKARAALAIPGVGVRVWYQARAAGNWVSLPVHWGVVSVPTEDMYGPTITVDSPDVAAKVALDRFTTPRTSSPGVTVVQQISLLLRDAVPWAGIEDQTGDLTPCPRNQVWATDRNDAITKLAQSIGAEMFWRPDGTFIIRRLRNLMMPADWVVQQGKNLVAATRSSDLTKSYNVIVASADSTDSGTSGVYAVSQDDDPSSPTFVGRVGRITGYYSSSLLTTNAQCQVMADSLRLRTQGAQVAVSYGGVVHPGVASGDRHDVRTPRGSFRVVCNQLTWDLFSGTASGSATAANLPTPQGVS